MAVKVKYWTDSSGQLAVDIKGIETTAIPPIACYGDSLTAGSGSSFNKEYPYILGTLLGNREVINRGVGGQHAPEIVCRTGTAAPLLTLSGNALPEAAAVALTEVSVDFLRLPKAGDTQIDGYLAGIAATVYATTVIESGTKTVNYSVQRAVAVDTGSVDIPPNTPFLVDAQGANKDYIPVIWVGRNDLSRARNKVDVEAPDKVDDIIRNKLFPIRDKGHQDFQEDHRKKGDHDRKKSLNMDHKDRRLPLSKNSQTFLQYE